MIATAPIINNNTTINLCPTVVNVVGGAAGVPGWPTKWPPLTTMPHPFLPSSFTITIDILRRAMSTDASNDDAYRRGDPRAMAALLVRIVKLVHSDPKERNIYLNPNRADQVLVYVPERWEVMTLSGGVRHILDHVVGELSESSPHLQLLARAAQEGFRTNKDAIVKNSCGAMMAHFENLASLARNGTAEVEQECWLGTTEDTQEISMPRMFGKERRGHLDLTSVTTAFETSFGVYRMADLGAADIPALARLSLAVFARHILANRPENLTIIRSSDQAVHVHTPWGWKEMPLAEAARQQARTLATTLVDYLELPEVPHLAPIAAHITQTLETLVDEEGAKLGILTRYTQAAERYYGSTVGPALAVPRRLLSEREAALAARAPTAQT